MNGGNRHLAAYSFLPPSDPNFDAVRDSLRQFSYSPDRARALLRETGWTPGADGLMRHASDGRAFRTAIWANLDADKEIAAYAAYWRAIGIEVEEFTIGSAQARDPAARAMFPGWRGRPARSSTRWPRPPLQPRIAGRATAGGYEDAHARSLVLAFTTSISPPDQLRAMRAINDFVVSEVLTLFTFANANFLGVREGRQGAGRHCLWRELEPLRQLPSERFPVGPRYRLEISARAFRGQASVGAPPLAGGEVHHRVVERQRSLVRDLEELDRDAGSWLRPESLPAGPRGRRSRLTRRHR